MDILEQLARPLAHGVQYDQIARSTLQAASAQEVEWMMAGLSRFQESLIRARWQQDMASRHAMYGALVLELMDRGWTSRNDPGRVEVLTLHVIDHWLGWLRTDLIKQRQPVQRAGPSLVPWKRPPIPPRGSRTIPPPFAKRIKPQKHVCSWCEGNRGVLFDRKWIDCENCKGTGRKEIKPHTLMRELGFARGSVYPVWIQRHHDALAYLDREESLALTHMGERLYGS